VAAVTSTAECAGPDGRTARRDRNRNAVLDAVLVLFAEGNLDPSPDEVARRSGVSLRSVYRYVTDRDDLVRSAIDRQQEKVRPLFAIDRVGEGSFAERVDAFVTARLRSWSCSSPRSWTRSTFAGAALWWRLRTRSPRSRPSTSTACTEGSRPPRRTMC
jgi:AcrR family transcriptional regulator